jgi:hypothetical protein
LKLRDDFGSYFGRAQVSRQNIIVCCEKLRWLAVCAIQYFADRRYTRGLAPGMYSKPR